MVIARYEGDGNGSSYYCGHVVRSTALDLYLIVFETLVLFHGQGDVGYTRSFICLVRGDLNEFFFVVYHDVLELHSCFRLYLFSTILARWW